MIPLTYGAFEIYFASKIVSMGVAIQSLKVSNKQGSE